MKKLFPFLLILLITTYSFALVNGDFETGQSPWTFFTNGSGNVSIAGGVAVITLTTVGTNMQFSQANIALEPNTDYKLSFQAYSNTGDDLTVSILENLSPYTNYGLKKTFDIGSSPGEHTYTFKTSGFTSPVTNGRLMFWFVGPSKDGDVYFIDNVLLEKVPVSPPPPPPPPPPPVPTISHHQLVQLTGLTPGEHCFQVSAFDAAGNESAKSVEQCVTLHESTEIFFSPRVFTDTVVGAKRYKTYTVTNTGTREMICNAPVIIGKNAGEFTTTFTTDKRSIPVGGSTTIRVYFEPKEVGDRIAVLYLSCNAYETLLAITLTGRGI